MASCSIAAAQSSRRRCRSLAPPFHQPRPRSSSVAHVAVVVADDQQEVEAEGQQGGAQQVPQRRQVRDGEAVGVFAAPPHGVDHPVGDAQQQQHLDEGEEGEQGEEVLRQSSRSGISGRFRTGGRRSCFDRVDSGRYTATGAR